MTIDAKQLQARRGYESRAALGILLQDLDQSEKVLIEIAALRRKIGIFAALSALTGLVSAVAASAAKNSALSFVAFVAFTLFIVLIVYLMVQGRGLHKNRDRIAIAQDLLKTLQHDAHARSAFSVRLELKAQPMLVREDPWDARRNGKQRLFEEEFLSVQGELLDGTALKETVTELTWKRTYTNQNRKTKTKIRNRYVVELRFAYPQDLYGDARLAAASLQEEIKLPSSATLRNTRVTEKAIVVKALVNLKQDIVQTSAMLSLGGYRILNLARRVTQSGARGTA